MKRSVKSILLQRTVIVWCLFFLLTVSGLSASATSSIPPAPHALSTSGTSTPVVPSPTSTEVATGTSSPTTTPVASSPGCGMPSPISPGVTAEQTVAVDPQVELGYSTRTYLLHVPTDYQPQLPLPLVLMFHGRGSNAAEAEGYTGFSQLAERERFLVVYPQGLQNPSGETFWDSFDPPTAGVDEVAFVNHMLDDLEQKLCIDTNRIYATGFSNGGNMTGMLACRMAGRIAAFAPVAGNFFDFRQGCHPGRPVALLNSHGTADDVVPYTLRPDVLDWLHQWAELDGCTTGPITFSEVSNVTAMQWTSCQDDVAIFHYRVEGEKHTWPKTLGNFPADETIWRFFLEYPLPPAQGNISG